MSKTKRFNLNRTPVYIPNQPSQKGGSQSSYIDGNDDEYYKERAKEHEIRMKFAKRRKR